MGHNNLTKCNNCGWVHFQVDLQYCKDWEKDWKAYWLSLSPKQRKDYGVESRPPTIEDGYLNCTRCGNSYKNFSTENIPDVTGSTISPILDMKEEYEKK